MTDTDSIVATAESVLTSLIVGKTRAHYDDPAEITAVVRQSFAIAEEFHKQAAQK